MLLSRFWYLVLALALGVSAFVLSVAAQLYNRSGTTAMSEALSADSSAVGWFLKDDARTRSSALIPIALSPDIRGGLAKVSPETKPNRESREKTRAALKKLGDDVPTDLKFDALWAVDANGRVIASVGDVIVVDEDWELGGYPIVADALHGWIRDDAWVWKGRIYRVVARPVEQEVNGEPVGAIVGAKIVDDKFASSVSKRTGAAVGFYAEGARVASWAPEGFDKSSLDVITQDLKLLDDNKDYQEKGRTEPRVIGAHLGVVYARLPGEAWDLGAGYAVGRLAVAVDSPLDFLNKADDTDKKSVPTLLIILGVLVAAGLGGFFSVLEHTRPLSVFRAEAARMAKGEIDVLSPSRFRGAYKKIASDLNDGIEKVAAKGGAPRRAADLEQVLGPIPAQPAMSAFSVPGGPGDASNESRPSFPKPPTSSQRGAPRLRQSGPNAPPSGPGGPPSGDVVEADLLSAPAPAPVAPTPPAAPAASPGRPPPPRPKPPVPGAPGAAAATPVAAAAVPAAPAAAAPANGGAPAASAAPAAAGPAPDEIVEWRKVYEDFLALKKQCNEPTANLTFEKFQGTLQRNKDALVARHACSRVKFTVYVKEGKAALKASPVK